MRRGRPIVDSGPIVRVCAIGRELVVALVVMVVFGVLLCASRVSFYPMHRS